MQYTKLFAYLGKGLNGSIKVFLLMCGTQLNANTCLFFWHYWIEEAIT